MYTVIIGDTEIEQNSVELKQMQQGTTESVALNDLLEVMKQKIK